jgi:hypothetical protein
MALPHTSFVAESIPEDHLQQQMIGSMRGADAHAEVELKIG